jgi:hypothetical protein
VGSNTEAAVGEIDVGDGVDVESDLDRPRQFLPLRDRRQQDCQQLKRP